ncbi:hypothetical protein HHI36_006682 [Cryptolaemus montrouzieri]|uniref:Pre-rRNA-processing protein TSR1 homolog n=1 Tax=Cryptolaemus montrouzieri TaxID=559131 RepID=A0ABD2NXT3_9CUCU
MGIDKQEAHRPGAFKQTNKVHKHGRHRSKGSISQITKGKISMKTISKRAKKELGKDQRRHQAVQIRKNKREEVLNKKRQIGGLDIAPFLVCILPLNQEHDPNTVLNLFSQCDPEAVVNKSPQGTTHVFIPRFKQRFAFICPPRDNDLAILDALKICDTVLFLTSAVFGEFINDWGENILVTALAQGLPTPILAMTDLESVALKKRHECKQEVQKSLSKWFPEEKIFTLDKEVDGINLLRKIGNQKRKPVHYRDKRPHLYAEHVEYVQDSGGLGTLKVTGYLRGAPLSVNGLIHLPGLGDYQMLQIDAPFDPYSIDKNKNNSTDKLSIRILEKCDPNKQEPLDSENIPDPMDAEQTWPTAEEIRLAEEEQKTKKVKKSPKVESDDESGDEDDYMEAMSEEHSDNSDEEDEEFETMTQSEVAVNDEKYDLEMDIEAEKKGLENLKQAKSDQMFPDEVDTPLDQAARVRYQKYRGLESFRTSPWDPKENLPSDYSRIFQFENFDRTKRRVLKEYDDVDGALPGWYITVHVKDVSELAWSSFEKTGSPVVLIGMFQHEHKMSVVNTVLKRTSNYNLPIKSKSRLIFQCGYRRFIVCPVFSQHTNGTKHKFERFFQPNSTSVATFFAPIQFPPAPVLCYKEINNKLILVATGNLLSCNPDRIVLKRIVLSGHPFKIHKKSAVIRFMFFSREDIVYFKPCKLRTKMGRIGHIKEPLGTHGHMKCIFDGQLKSQDTVLLNLYKRVYPKWTFENLEVTLSETSSGNMDI